MLIKHPKSEQESIFPLFFQRQSSALTNVFQMMLNCPPWSYHPFVLIKLLLLVFQSAYPMLTDEQHLSLFDASLHIIITISSHAACVSWQGTNMHM